MRGGRRRECVTAGPEVEAFLFLIRVCSFYAIMLVLLQMLVFLWECYAARCFPERPILRFRSSNQSFMRDI